KHLASRILLRAEVRRDGRWVADVDTLGAATADFSADTFDAPAGWQEITPAARDVAPEYPPATGPALPGLCPGPFMAHPDVFAVYWGNVFTDHPDFVGAMNAAISALFDARYSAPLSTYGIDTSPGRFLGHNVSTRSLPRLVGQADFISIAHELWTNSDTPKVWPTVGGHDPLVAFFVDSQDVDDSGWGGYHFNSNSPAILIPLPFHLFTPH